MADSLIARFNAACERHGWLQLHGSLHAALAAIESEAAELAQRAPADVFNSSLPLSTINASTSPMSFVTKRRKRDMRRSAVGHAPGAPCSPLVRGGAATSTIISQVESLAAASQDASDSENRPPVHSAATAAPAANREPSPSPRSLSFTAVRKQIISDEDDADDDEHHAAEDDDDDDDDDDDVIGGRVRRAKRLTVLDSSDEDEDGDQHSLKGTTAAADAGRHAPQHQLSESSSAASDSQRALLSDEAEEDDGDHSSPAGSPEPSDGETLSSSGSPEQTGGHQRQHADKATGAGETESHEFDDENSDEDDSGSLADFIVDDSDEEAEPQDDADSDVDFWPAVDGVGSESASNGEDVGNAESASASDSEDFASPPGVAKRPAPAPQRPPMTPKTPKQQQPSKERKNLAATPGLRRRQFAGKRESLARSMYTEFNASVFSSQLPEDLPLVWSAKLNTTAGRATLRRHGDEYSASIELSIKVVDCEERLANTLCHEMCHVAAWLINHVSKPPHGADFKRWAARAMRYNPHLNITTCHSYDIDYKFRWQCQTADCGAIIGRHSRSIDETRHRCGRCHGMLRLMPRLKVDGTPCKQRQPSAFSVFVKRNFARTKADNPGLAHGDIMKQLGNAFKTMQLDKDVSVPTTATGGDKINAIVLEDE